MKDILKNFSLVFIFSFIILYGGETMKDQKEKPPLLYGTGESSGYYGVNQTISAQDLFLKNVKVAIDTAKRAKLYFIPGKVWCSIAPRGETEIKAGIVYNGVVVGILHFSPLSGSVLPLGVPPAIYNVQTSSVDEKVKIVKMNLPKILKDIKVLEGVEFREPENAWVIPLSYNGMIVSHIRVYVDGIHIVPDYPANQEMQAYGK